MTPRPRVARRGRAQPPGARAPLRAHGARHRLGRRDADLPPRRRRRLRAELRDAARRDRPARDLPLPRQRDQAGASASAARGRSSSKREDLERLERLHGVERAAPHVPLGPRLMRAAGRTKLVWTYGVSADTPRHPQLPRPRADGRSARDDVEAGARVVLLGAKVGAPPLRRRASRRAASCTSTASRSPWSASRAPKDDQVLYIGPADDEVAMIPITHRAAPLHPRRRAGAGRPHAAHARGELGRRRRTRARSSASTTASAPATAARWATSTSRRSASSWRRSTSACGSSSPRRASSRCSSAPSA